MSDFGIFFPTGIEHITDLSGIDHILFVAALCLRYTLTEWKKILVLVTAFTIGHSITLALSTLNILNISRDWTEFLIAVTIIITALNNCMAKDVSGKRMPLIYFYALFFGLIHGLGFSTLLKSMLGRDQSIIVQLLAFNLGLEVGQIIIVIAILLISFIFVRLLKINRREYVLFFSGCIAALALQMAIDRYPIKKEDKQHEKTALLHNSNSVSCFCECPGHSKQSRV
ncbi:HupE/UreJ family protein [Danxiaibacter flavus]|uniref:HupE/UreJ family protein n=1 Tax=Danxiaibacter flavus TaxID=3049108 RepID=A0ABV3ZMK6_9BACT|nr:HupE/UreJ family protein [Chitinophagaceae bacterium DXS]